MVRKFIHLLLFQAQQDQAIELVIGVSLPDGGTPIKYKVKDSWVDLAPFPSHVRPLVISEFARMVNLPEGKSPDGSVLEVIFGKKRSKWTIAMKDLEGECTLVRIQD